MVGGMSLQQAEPFLDHATAYMRPHTSSKKALRWAILGLTMQQRGVQGECGGRIGEGCGRSVGGHVFRATEASEGGSLMVLLSISYIETAALCLPRFWAPRSVVLTAGP